MNRFNEALQELQPELALKKTKYDPAAWDKNFIELKELRENCQTYRIYALRTLGQAAVTAAERLRSADGTRSDVGTQYEQNDNIDVGIEQVVNVDEDTVYDDLDDVQKLMKFFICYVNGELMNDAQGTFLRKMMEQRVSIQDRLLASAAESLLNEDGWTNQMEINIKLCLSSIVSLISPESIAFTKTILTSSQMTSLIELSVSETFGFSDECIRVFDELISERTIFEPDSIIENIYKLQAKYCWHKNSDLYRMLCILQQVISQFDDWSEQTDESENTVFRRFAVLLDILFRYTKIKMRDGECVAQTTKDEIIVLQTIAGFVSSSNEAPYGSKVDLIATACFDGKLHDLSSNEWKKDKAYNSIVLKQQAKNIRTNATILSRLLRMGCSESIIAIDWKGEHQYHTRRSCHVGNSGDAQLAHSILVSNGTELQQGQAVAAEDFPEMVFDRMALIKQTHSQAGLTGELCAFLEGQLIARYLLGLQKQGISLTHMNTTRSALASVYKVMDPMKGDIASDRLMQSFSQAARRKEVRLPNSADEIWDVDVLLKLVQSWGPSSKLSLVKLQHKTLVLLAIASMWRIRSDLGQLQWRDVTVFRDHDNKLKGLTLLIHEPKESQAKVSNIRPLSDQDVCPVYTTALFIERTTVLAKPLPPDHH
ncbi:hypothetical protein BDB00DRAFT_872731 [Zychaea mexicana]|uniref:uncharacterized protein n=1 Tax=Zychaea mexicana TaxID=64656 RepID=UPI0022FEB3FF|nr:uncharacterized protein BDB00DRAFT_872731 [Zychaea mexicana]KAI9493018.1 hypothetical protein BDB00DRAFT_872731 [Zychaea mexicana]